MLTTVGIRFFKGFDPFFLLVSRIRDCLDKIRASLVAQMVKNLPAMWDQEDPLEEEMATYSSILAWRILWTEKPGRTPVGHH